MGWGSEPIPIFEAKNSGTQKRCQWLELRKTPRQSLGELGGIFSGESPKKTTPIPITSPIAHINGCFWFS